MENAVAFSRHIERDPGSESGMTEWGKCAMLGLMRYLCCCYGLWALRGALARHLVLIGAFGASPACASEQEF